MSDDNETVTISLTEYKALLEAELFLGCLEEAGVDNWAFYDEAKKEFKNQKASL